MSYPQPIASFGGIVGIEAATFLLSRGVQPSGGVVSTPVLGQLAPPIADFTITYNGQTITLTGCAAVESFVSFDGRGQTLTIKFVDRRWRWRLAELIGRYNIRLQPDTVEADKSPHELVALIGAAIGETIDATALPNGARPYIDWTHTPADAALADLLGQLGCDIAPDLSTGQFRVVKIGAGELLPAAGSAENPIAGATFPVSPERIQVITAPNRYQCLFKLEPVGLDTDDSWQPLHDLSYKPTAGWEPEDPNHFDGVEATYEKDGAELECRDLAFATVYRCWRIVEIVDAAGAKHLDPPGFEEARAAGAPEVSSIQQLLPLLSMMNDFNEDATTGEIPWTQRPYVVGRWYEEHDPKRAEGNVDVGSRWTHGFTLDSELGIVHLSTLAQLDSEDESGDYLPADLYLMAVCEVTWGGLNKKTYYGRYRDGVGVVSPTLIKSQYRGDAVLKYTTRYEWDPGDEEAPATVNSVENNLTAVNQQLDYYLDAMEDELANQQGGSCSYADLLLISPDGAIEQVEWTVDASGMTTRAARFTRLAGYLPDYKEMQRQAKVTRAIEEADLGRFRGDVTPPPWQGAIV